LADLYVGELGWVWRDDWSESRMVAFEGFRDGTRKSELFVRVCDHDMPFFLAAR
jgi:hypothetical protein